MDLVQWLSPYLGVVFLICLVLVGTGLYAGVMRWIWRQRGKGFAEGWFEVVERRGQLPQRTASIPASAEMTVIKPMPTAARAVPMDEKTAARIQDAGHRWLGNTK